MEGLTWESVFVVYGVFLFTCLLQAQYLIVLCTFKEQLQQHVRVHAVEAVMACREIENNLQALTGLSPLFLSLPLPLLLSNNSSNNHH